MSKHCPADEHEWKKVSEWDTPCGDFEVVHWCKRCGALRTRGTDDDYNVKCSVVYPHHKKTCSNRRRRWRANTSGFSYPASAGIDTG